MFATQFSKRPRFISSSGCPTLDTYGYVYSKDGKRDLVKTGVTDVHARIQADRDSCNINLIIKAFTNGEVDALNQVKGFYADVRDLPTSYAELVQLTNDASDLFRRLPVDVKEKYNNSAVEFWQNSGTQSWFESLGYEFNVEKPVEKSVTDVVESEVE